MNTKENIERQRSNAIELLFEKGWTKFPKNYNTNKEFKITNFKNNQELYFEVKENGRFVGHFFMFYSTSFRDSLYKGNNDHALRFFVADICNEMYNKHLTQLDAKEGYYWKPF